jgi:hypothetical protein
MRKLFCAVLILSVLLATQIPGYAQRPAVDGFIGVPWGASRAQVQAAMAKKGFTLLEQRADGVFDRYTGTFAGHPAELEFSYEKNVFHYGQAELLDAQMENWGPRTNAMVMIYREMVQVLAAKYGPPDETYIDVPGENRAVASVWENIPTTATPPGKVAITIYGKAGNLRNMFTVRVDYSINRGWALQKTGKGDDY